MVFCLKAAILPLSAWLPGTYGAAGAPALVLFERVLHMEMPGNESVENAVKGSALGGYAVALTKAGRYKQAARVAEQAASVAEQLYGPHHENTLTSRFNLGAVYEASGTRACSCSCARARVHVRVHVCTRACACSCTRARV